MHLALSHGRWGEGDEVLVRVHEPFTALDLLDTGSSQHSWPLPQALGALQSAPSGVAVLLNCAQGVETLLPQALARPLARTSATPMDLRTYGVGAQILRDLGIRRMKLLGSPRRMPSMTGFGLEVTGFQPSAA
jgi:3,4-dihydroxy 2-butanone 4-phosphate synthase/GTP cyclohydrolase II